MSRKPKSVIIADDVPWYAGDVVRYIYGDARVALIREKSDLYPERITSGNFDMHLPGMEEVEVIFSSWGMLPLTSEQLEGMPKLKAVFYAGGSVSGFADSFFERGVTICNAVAANAIPVAEFCLAQILLSCKRAYTNSGLCREKPWLQSEMPVGAGVYGETIALLSIGAISRKLIELLKPFNLRVIAVSNYLTEEEALMMGIDELVDIETAFKEAYVVSNHMADKPENQHILTESHFASMREGSTFINTGRGAQVDEPSMIAVLKNRSDLTALLDVQHPEPPEEGSELYTLPNVHMTSHIAGSTNDEVQRMADFVLDDFQRWLDGAPLFYEVEPLSLLNRA